MNIPAESTVFAEVRAILEEAVPELADGIHGPVDELPLRLSGLLYFGPHTVTIAGFDIEHLDSTIAVTVAHPRNGPYAPLHDLITQTALAVYGAIPGGTYLEESDLLVIGPVTIGQTALGVFRPAGTDTVSATVSFTVERKGGSV